MPRSLATLHRLREHARKVTDAELRKAEAEREKQAQRLDALASTLVSAREGLDDGDAGSITTWYAYRLQQELQVRREEARLAQRDRETDARRARHVVAVREELAVEGLMDRREADEAQEAARKERLTMDEIASRSRRTS